MSSVYLGENPRRRKSKVSYATFIDVGLVGPKVYPKGVTDGQQVKIPTPPNIRFNTKGGHGKVG